MSYLQIIHWIAGFIVLAEALNKLERTTPFAAGLQPRQRVVDGLKALAWLALATGAAGALAGPLLPSIGIVLHHTHPLVHQAPSLAETLVLAGFSVLIFRTRVKEG